MQQSIRNDCEGRSECVTIRTERAGPASARREIHAISPLFFERVIHLNPGGPDLFYFPHFELLPCGLFRL